MVDNKRVTPEELQKLTDIRHRYDSISFQYGKLEFAISALSKEQVKVKKEYDELATEEEKVMSALIEKYGGGSINLETGEIIPEED